jgi:hypothetical protein
MGELRITLYQRRLANGVAERPEVPACLREGGHHVREADDGALGNWPATDLLWLQGNANWFPRVCRQLERSGARKPHILVWHTEPLPPGPRSGLRTSRLHFREIAKIILRDRRATDPYTNAARLRRLRRFELPDVLVVSARSRQKYLASRGIESHFIPLGYHAATHGRLLGLQRDVDVLFLGTMQVPRRNRLVAQLRRAGVQVRAEGSWNDGSTWGEDRTQLLNRTKVLLNLQRHPGDFSGMRRILGMSNGALVISEPIDQPEPYVPGRHYIETTAELMPEVIRHYLERPDEREQIIAQAYRLVTEELTMQTSVQRILKLADVKL